MERIDRYRCWLSRSQTPPVLNAVATIVVLNTWPLLSSLYRCMKRVAIQNQACSAILSSTQSVPRVVPDNNCRLRVPYQPAVTAIWRSKWFRCRNNYCNFIVSSVGLRSKRFVPGSSCTLSSANVLRDILEECRTVWKACRRSWTDFTEYSIPDYR